MEGQPSKSFMVMVLMRILRAGGISVGVGPDRLGEPGRAPPNRIFAQIA
jgi:hypothetical protein